MHRQEMQKPIHILIHGGPGTGKSFLTRCINNAAKEMDYSIMYVAFTGIAAANLPNGKTIHNHFNFSINDLKKSNFFPDLPTDKLNQLRSRLSTSKLVMLVIDEISYSTPETIGQIDNRLRQLMGKPEIPFGGIAVLLMGDFFSITTC
jgi:ATP-dependent DNA helicase PIF1